jgi:hypothetical protein
MGYQQLFIFVEGNDDERFIEKIRSVFDEQYDYVKIYKYRQTPPKQTKKFLRAITAMKSNCFFLADINSLPCPTAKKEKITNMYGKSVALEKIMVVIKEIESWYLAGLDDDSCRELGVKTFTDTNNITKEQFNTIMPKKFDSRIDFMQEILKRFCLTTARQNNNSLDYFLTKI